MNVRLFEIFTYENQRDDQIRRQHSSATGYIESQPRLARFEDEIRDACGSDNQCHKDKYDTLHEGSFFHVRLFNFAREGMVFYSYFKADDFLL
jgi:hypothetical protein